MPRPAEKFDRYGVDAIMIGRATFGRPWIFREIQNEGDSGLTIDDKIDVLEEMLRINVERIDEYRGILHTVVILPPAPSSRAFPTSARPALPCSVPTKWPISSLFWRIAGAYSKPTVEPQGGRRAATCIIQHYYITKKPPDHSKRLFCCIVIMSGFLC